jgi:hypothetical protein
VLAQADRPVKRDSNMKKLVGGVLLGAALLVPACSSDESPTASVSDTVFEASTTTVAEADADQVVREWVEAVGSYSAAEIEPAIQLSANGSPAQQYATYLVASLKARQDAGYPMFDAEVTVTPNGDGSIEWCARFQGEEACYTGSDFEVDAAGKVVDAAVNGTHLAERIVGEGAPVDMPGGTAKRLYGFKSSDGSNLYVVVELQAGDGNMRTPYSASYVGPNGAQVASDSSASIVPTGDVLAGAKRVAVYTFMGAEMPGRLVFQDACDETFETCVDVTLPVGK